MTRVPVRGRFLALGIGLALLSGGPGYSAEPDEHPKKAVFKATVEVGPHEEEERTFDLSQAAKAEELSALLRKGEVSHLERDDPVNILEIKWDLGLWTLVVFLLLILILRRV